MSDLADLFARDPLKLTREDIASMIERYRGLRTQFNAGAIKSTKAASVKPAKPGATSGLSLGLQLKFPGVTK